MPTKKRTPKKRSNIKKPSKASSLNWRPIIIFGLAAVPGIIVLVIHHAKPGFNDARSTADAFINATINCDVATIKKVAPLIGANEDKMATYTKNCKPGVITAHFLRQTTDATDPNAVTFTYKQYDPTQPVYKNADIILQVIKPDGQATWEVGLVSGVPEPN